MLPRSGLLVFSAAFALCLEPARASAQSATQFSDPQRLAKLSSAIPEIDRIMASFAERSNVPGIAYGIIVDGKVVHIGTAGLRNVATREPVDTSTVFRIASMSKSFAALSILKLRDEGKLSLEDPAEKYVPELKQLRYPTTDSPRITVRHLLSHSAGFPEDNPWGDQQLSRTDAEMSRMMRSGIPFSTSPGTNYEYSNFGFAILGRIVQNVSGMPYARYLQQQILRPLGMTSTTLEVKQVPANRLAHGYRRQDGQWLEEPQLPDGAFGPMGGMLTSVADLGKWVAFMLDAWPPRDGAERGPVKRSSVREMQQVVRYNGATAVRDTSNNTIQLSAGGYGYGLGVRQTCLFPISVSHSGGLPGFGSLMRWLPEYGVGIVALGSLTYTGWGTPVNQAFDALVKTGGLVAREPTPAPILVQRREQVSRLVNAWNDRLADSIASMNLFLDESKERRRTSMEALVAKAGGECRSEGPMLAENSLRGVWRMRCRDGDLRVGVTLAPTVPAGVQLLTVTPMRREQGLAFPPVCR
jgi:CubicO group peptidase (beta-lactamase class C family)